jgi:predicted phosphodiesterase
LSTTPWYCDREQLLAEVEKHGSCAAAGRAHGVKPNTVVAAWNRLGLPRREPGPKAEVVSLAAVEHDDGAWLLALLKKHGDDATVEQLADAANCAPKTVRETAEKLGLAGFRIDSDDDRIVLQRVAPSKTNVHPGLFAGTDFRIGVVSDTHLCSNEEALDELHCAYDVFQKEGITTVLHAGDIVTGRGIYRGQEQETKEYTIDGQAEYAIANYPARDGIITHVIGGNHDLEGEAGRVGYDPVKKIADARDDIDYLGAWDAWLEFGGAWVHVLHGKGGMSYSYSYKAQKLVDGYPGGRKPAVLIPGHWHVRGNVRARDVEILWPGCFEWQSPFLKRLGLHPAVGFHILEFTVGDDGSLVKWRPEWFPFYAGRTVEKAA